MEEPVIELHGIRKSYGKKEVLKGIDLQSERESCSD
jgi:ABC-type histidine transport system ATPase subunit